MDSTLSPGGHRHRESRFLMASIAALVIGSTLLRMIASRLLGFGILTGSVFAWAVACGCLGLWVARRRDRSSAGEAVMLAIPMSAIGMMAGALTSLF